jgi:hypothetical protein
MVLGTVVFFTSRQQECLEHKALQLDTYSFKLDYYKLRTLQVLHGSTVLSRLPTGMTPEKKTPTHYKSMAE